MHDLPGARVVFAAGARHRLPEETARLGLRRVLFVGGDGPLRRTAGELVAALGGTVAARIDEVVQHVPAAEAAAAVRTARRCGADGLVALGGGSATGLAKAVALEMGLPVLAVPTTYAGSEMTDIWGRTDDHAKTTGRDPRVRPRTVIYDVELTLGMPAALTAASGLNALAHCAEAAYDPAAGPVVRLLAVEGARALAAGLPDAVARGRDLAARAETLYGAWLAGTALGAARMGVHHSLCHLLGGAFALPHAETHAVVLPHAIAFNRQAARAALAPLDRALGAGPGGSAAALWDLGRRVGVPRSLAELGLSREDALRTAEALGARAVTNPRPVGPGDARELVLAAYHGLRPATG
ncbi:maleylacetate reductase [Streptomyces aidingensis]|uniref:maleylacetate reductase n=1 Tax=Streptomyces aidingensis TaxID=910347 RepID=UPI001FE815EC|nr:maleylacetate reductase [Streptomyces aidingensis]